MSTFSIPPQPDIDGLRAIAVLLVVAFHAFPSWVRGGFIGVDVFFVISGYLISTIIFENLERGTFSFAEFYARRVKRIFPALLLVFVASYSFGWFALLADEYKQLGKHIAAGAGFVSNIVLWNEAGYFDNSAETKPLLHLWSLGIEEQFYIVWPLLLWMAWKRKFNLLTITILVAVVSFYLNVNGIRKDAVATFYSPQTRFWELLCGSLLAWVTLYKKDAFSSIRTKIDGWLASALYKEKLEPDGKALSNVLSFLGMFLLALGFWPINKGYSFPGKWAIVPVLGAVLTISACPNAWVNRTVLSNRLAVWFGLISFPLYLWHWPLLSFARIIEGEVPSRSIRISAVITSVAFAWLTYKFVESPIRLGKRSIAKTTVLIVLTAFVGSVGYSTYRRDGFKFRDSIKLITPILEDKVIPGVTRTSDGSCEKKLNLQTASGTICLTNSQSPEVLIVGDSHSMALNSAAYLNKLSVKTLLIGVHGCAPLYGYSLLDGSSPRQGCDSLAAQFIEIADHYENIKKIIISTRGPFYFSGEGDAIEGKSNFSIVAQGGNRASQAEMFYKGYSAFVSKLINLKKDVVFVIEVPELGEDPAGCIVNRPFTLTKKFISSCSQDKVKVIARQAIYREMVHKIKSDNASLKVYDPLDVFCDSATCYGMRNGKLLYWDDNHISVTASEIVMSDLLSKEY